MVFIRLEKAYEEMLYRCLEKKTTSIVCDRIIKDMYEKVMTSVRTCGRDTVSHS